MRRITESRRAYSLLQREQTKERQKALNHKKEVKKLQRNAEKERQEKEKAVNEVFLSSKISHSINTKLKYNAEP